MWLTWCTNNNFYPTPSLEVNTWCTCTVYPDIHICPSYNFWIRFYVNGGICVGVLEMKHANTVTFDVMTEFYSAQCSFIFPLFLPHSFIWGKVVFFLLKRNCWPPYSHMHKWHNWMLPFFFYLWNYFGCTKRFNFKGTNYPVHVHVVVLWLGLCLYLRAVVLLTL